MPETQAYWISKEGEVLDAGQDHLGPIIDRPDSFGLSHDRIQELYASHGGSVGAEGTARDLIIREAAQHGWIRARRYKEPANRIIVQAFDVSSRAAFVHQVLANLRDRGIVASSDTVVLSDYETGEARSFRMSTDADTEDQESLDGFLESGE